MKRLSMADALEEQWISGFIAGAVVVGLIAPEAQYFWREIQEFKKLAQKELLEDFARKHVDLLKKDLDE